MKERDSRIQSLGSVLLLNGCILMTACGANYPAPISEQGERRVVNAPIIVDSSTPRSSYRLPRQPVPVISSAGDTSGRIAARPAARPGINAESHRVGAGDTLFSIAFQYDLDFRRLAIANDLNPPYTIFVGQEINLDTGRVPDSRSGGDLGTPVEDNAVARTQGSISRPGGLTRRTIGQTVDSVSNSEPGWQWPLRGEVLSGFQANVSKGIDIGGRVGDPVLAAADGDVVYSGQGVQGSGNLIIIRHNDRYLSAYAHNSAMLANLGHSVQAGDKIAEVGHSPAGVAMLHFEIRVDGRPVNPAELLPHR